jgi:signal transduction histidine kinase
MPNPAGRLPAIAPRVPPPPRFVERRVRVRRASDRQLLDERRLLARSLDVLVGAPTAEARLAGVLDLLAVTAGASRAALLAPGLDRRVAVTIARGEATERPAALAAWLDATAPRPRSQRAGATPAEISFMTLDDDWTTRTPASDACDYAWLPLPGGDLAIGFECPSVEVADAIGDRLPQQLLRHAAVVLSLVADQLRIEREIATLRAADAERGRFVSTVAHDLRTPLTGLSGYLDLILDGRVDDATQVEFLERSRQIVGSMADLVGDLLDVSRIEAGTLALEIGRFSLSEAVARVVETVAPLAAERGIAIERTLEPRLRMALADRRRVEQIVTNLLANALKFSPSGSRVEVATAWDGPVALTVVRDEGPGIPPAERSRIFDRFQRLEVHAGVTGTGLGLAIARDLARAMSGELEVASIEESGSSFVLALPGLPGAAEDVLAEALARRLELEEAQLEERGLVRRLAAASAARRPSAPPAAASAPTPPKREAPLRKRRGPGQAGRPELRILPDPVSAS